MSKRAVLLLTPKTLFLIKGQSLLELDSLQELPKLKIFDLDIVIDGFSQEFAHDHLPLMGPLDRRSAVFHKLSNVFKRAVFFGGAFAKRKNRLKYDGFGFARGTKLDQFFNELLHLKLSIHSVQSLVFSCAPPLLSHFLKQIQGQSVLWISPFLKDGLRLVFYRQQEIKFVRYIPYTLKNPASEKDLLHTLSHIHNEYACDLKDVKIFITAFDKEDSQSLKDLSKSSAVMKWGNKELQRLQKVRMIDKSHLIELWLISYGQKKKSYRNFVDLSPLKDLITRTRWLKVGAFCLRSLCLVMCLFVSSQVYHVWSLKNKILAVEKRIKIKKEKVDKLLTSLHLPSGLDPKAFSSFLSKQDQQDRVKDPCVLLSSLEDILKPHLLVQEFLWRGLPKPELKMSLRYLNAYGIDKKAIINQFKINLMETLKQQGEKGVIMHQKEPHILEVCWP